MKDQIDELIKLKSKLSTLEIELNHYTFETRYSGLNQLPLTT